MAPLHETRAQMHVKQVQDGPGALHVGSQTAAPLPVLPGEVVILRQLHGKAGERGIAVCTSAQPAIFAETNRVPAEAIGNELRLIFFRLAAHPAEYFLKRDDVST